jgi:hypothetical protein
VIGSPQEPVVEEARETILAQIEALEAGTIPVVMLPIGSTFIPAYHSKLRHVDIPNHAGAGRYLFDPQQIPVGMLLALVKAGRHHQLLGHVQSKAQILGPPVVVRAIRSDGVVLQDSLVSDEQPAILAQMEALRNRFPGARLEMVNDLPRILEARTESRAAPGILQAFQQDQYRLGNLQAIGYLRTRSDVFPPGFLGTLYHRMQTGLSGKRGDSWLRMLFCGMADVSFDAIVPYLASRPLCILGEWRGAVFAPAGLIFPTVQLGLGDQKAAFAGYGFFREWWGTEEQKTLALLGIAFFFVELGLVALHGMRYAENSLTRNFLAGFGFKETGRIPRYMLRNGKLVDGVASSLLREDFEAYVERQVVEEYERGRSEPGNAGQDEPPWPGLRSAWD